MKQVVVIGAGIGGLATAGALARQGIPVTVLEAHIYPGGCAGTFFHRGYRFDAGATLAGGFYPGGPMDIVRQRIGGIQFPAHPADPSMTVHLPDGSQIIRWSDERRFAEHRAAFGRAGEAFWRWQEEAADAIWSLALRLPPWPPQSPAHFLSLARKAGNWIGQNWRRHLKPGIISDAFRPVAAHLHEAPERLRMFVDAQLLISAQATSPTANALYGAAALDLPRRGVVHLSGGMGAFADTLAQAVRQNGGNLLYRQEVTEIVMENGRPVAVKTRRGESFPADVVIANLTPWNIRELLKDAAPQSLRRLPVHPEDAWGAYVLYVGLDDQAIPDDSTLHHQVVAGEPLGEGNSIFLSLSPAWDSSRAPAGQRALTISTHTRLADWWQLKRSHPESYEHRKTEYANRLLTAATRVIPEIRSATRLVMPGTPVTFEHFTRRENGWVGGFPQTNLFRSWGPHLAPGLWMVGDSIFPGQSTAAVALGGLRVADEVELELESLPVLEYRKGSTPQSQNHQASQRSQGKHRIIDPAP